MMFHLRAEILLWINLNTELRRQILEFLIKEVPFIEDIHSIQDILVVLVPPKKLFLSSIPE